MVMLIGCLAVYSRFFLPIRFTFRTLVGIVVLFFVLTVIRVGRGENLLFLLLSPDLIFEYIGLDDMLVTMFTSGENIAPYVAYYYVIDSSSYVLPGESLLYTLVGFVPRFLWHNRPDGGAYYNYVHDVSSNPDRGFGFLHFADWYMNFSIAFPVVAGLLMGFVYGWVCLHSARKHTLTSILLYAIFAGNSVQIIRAGIDGYKAMALELIIVPLFFVGVVYVMSSAASRIRRKRAYCTKVVK